MAKRRAVNCTHCGTRNVTSAGFCIRCEKPLDLDPATRIEPTFDMRDTETMADMEGPAPRPAATPAAPASRALYDLAIGHRNRAYYLARFGAFDAEGSTSLAWHWPSFFFTFCWLLYRKMWGQAAVYVAASCLIAFAASAAAGVSPGLAALGYGAYLIGVFFLPALIANSVYYWHCQRLIARARAASQDPKEQLSVLMARGGTANAAVIRALALAGIVIALILAAVALPTHEVSPSKPRVESRSSLAARGSA